VVKTVQPPSQWENILASLEEGIILMGRDGRLLLMNPAAEDMMMTSHSQATGKTMNGQFRHNPWIIDLVKRTQTSGSGHRAEGDLRRHPGKTLPVSVTSSPYVDSFGHMEGTVLVLHDITTRRALEEDLMHSERLAMLGTFTAGLLHEIRNPLGGIKGAAQLLGRKDLERQTLAESVSVILREVDRLDRLLGQLLTLSQTPRLNMASLNIHMLLDNVLLLERHLLEENKISVKRELDPSLPLIWGDPERLTQVFLNLVKNAREAMEGGGVLRLSTKMETDFHLLGEGRERFVRVEVEDSGPGIVQENLRRIFEPFFTTKKVGTGLGLPIAYRIVSEHGGMIRAESTSGKGTLFKVSLRVERETHRG
jgi:two-component system nitrogen regulation sensor histidine kinase GlnL